MSSERGGPGDGELACPSCARHYDSSQRFCPECGMPLVHAAGRREEPDTERHGRARKIKPQYLGGNLVKVGWARNQAEAELIQGLLLEEGIPSVQRRTQGFDVPQFLAAGPRDVLVSEAAYALARELLAGIEARGDAPGNGDLPDGAADGAPLGGIGGSPARLAVWVLAATAGAAAIVYALYELTA